jgi:hypothetical protein
MSDNDKLVCAGSNGQRSGHLQVPRQSMLLRSMANLGAYKHSDSLKKELENLQVRSGVSVCMCVRACVCARVLCVHNNTQSSRNVSC